MTDLHTLLENGDPVRKDRELPSADAQRMRRIIVAAALDQAPARTPWQRPFAIAALGVLLAVVGTMTGHRVIVQQSPALAPTEPVSTLGGSTADGDRRQLQFSTPGGTRIIWIFDQNLRLQESMP
jgi:hypothetical protein